MALSLLNWPPRISVPSKSNATADARDLAGVAVVCFDMG